METPRSSDVEGRPEGRQGPALSEGIFGDGPETAREPIGERPSRSAGSLLRSVSHDASTLLRKEAALLRAELREKVDQVTSGVTSLGVGSLIAFAGLLVLLDAAVYALAQVVDPLWLSALIVGGVVALIGLILLLRARSKLKAQNLAPERSAASLRRDADMAFAHGESARHHGEPRAGEPMPGPAGAAAGRP